MEVYFPIAPLSPFIKKYLVIESREGMVNRTLPDTALVMSFRYKGQVRFLSEGTATDLPSFTLSGLRRSDRLISYAGDTANILVLFREAAASAFIREPLQDLFETSLPLEDLAGYKHLSLMGEQLAEAASNAARIALVEKFLLSRLYQRPSDVLVGAAIGKIQAAKGVLKMKELAGSLYISQDAFEKRFRRLVGVSPKQFAFITKMRAVVNSAVHKPSLADLAFDAGYYDLPHFNKDFKLFTGRTPTEFMRSPVIM